jgi:hypothetical protein
VLLCADASAESLTLADLLIDGGIVVLVVLFLIVCWFVFVHFRPPTARILQVIRTRAPNYIYLVSVLFLTSLSVNVARLLSIALVRFLLCPRLRGCSDPAVCSCP